MAIEKLNLLKETWKLVSNQIIGTFGREASVIDSKILDVVLSNPTNKNQLIERLNNLNNRNSIEVVIDGETMSFADSQ